MVNHLHLAALWVRDWVVAATHDPDFWMMRFFCLKLPQVKISRYYQEIHFSIEWHDLGRFRLGCPSDWNEWGPSPNIDYLYDPSNQAIDYDEIPF